MLSNHDVTRHLTRYGRANTGSGWQPDPGPPDLALGTRRARAAIMLSLALPGSCYLYQGEELGLWEVEDIPDELIADPIYERTDHSSAAATAAGSRCPGRPTRPASDSARRTARRPGCRSRMRGGSSPRTRRRPDSGSMLALYRTALRLRRSDAYLRRRRTRDLAGELPRACWRSAEEAAARSFSCVVNISAEPVPLPRTNDALWPADQGAAAGHRRLARTTG